MKTFFLILGFGFVCFITGLAVADLGQVPKVVTQPYDWTLPFTAFCVTFFPFLCGYWGGKEKE